MIAIDGKPYNIPIVSIDMAADMLDKYAERTNDGVLHRELIGVYYNFKITFGPGYDNPTEYAALWRALAEPKEFHEVTLWDEAGPYTQEGYFASTNQKLTKVKSDKPYWRELSTTFIAKQPRIG